MSNSNQKLVDSQPVVTMEDTCITQADGMQTEANLRPNNIEVNTFPPIDIAEPYKTISLKKQQPGDGIAADSACDTPQYSSTSDSSKTPSGSSSSTDEESGSSSSVSVE